MTPTWSIITGDCREALATLPDESVHCVCTSPPYWGLRDYGVAGQLGLEESPQAWVDAMVGVFRELRRVLRRDGTCWVNVGDAYAGSGGFAPDAPCNQKRAAGDSQAWGKFNPASMAAMGSRKGSGQVAGLKPKDLIGLPWRLAFALQADGWYLRSDIIWSKPNPMPESCTDRPTKAHEHVFLLSRSPRYFWDAEAVREPHETTGPTERVSAGRACAEEQGQRTRTRPVGRIAGYGETGRNIRDVWTIATHPYKESHFATFPPKLVEPCVKAGTSEKGACPECGAPWMRERTKDSGGSIGTGGWHDHSQDEEVGMCYGGTGKNNTTRARGYKRGETTGWRHTCDHDAEPTPTTVLDPFAGAGTTGLVALRLRRSFIGIELNPDYAEMARKRIRDDAPLYFPQMEVTA